VPMETSCDLASCFPFTPEPKIDSRSTDSPSDSRQPEVFSCCLPSFELDAGWASQDGTIRVTGGWMVIAWYNTLKVADYLRAVQNMAPGVSSFNIDHEVNKPRMFDGLAFPRGVAVLTEAGSPGLRGWISSPTLVPFAVRLESLTCVNPDAGRSSRSPGVLLRPQ